MLSLQTEFFLAFSMAYNHSKRWTWEWNLSRQVGLPGRWVVSDLSCIRLRFLCCLYASSPLWSWGLSAGLPPSPCTCGFFCSDPLTCWSPEEGVGEGDTLQSAFCGVPLLWPVFLGCDLPVLVLLEWGQRGEGHRSSWGKPSPAE